jgi:hypothetical protein
MVQWWLQYCRGTKWVQFYVCVHVFDLKIRMSNRWFGIQKVLHLLSWTPLPLHSYPKCTKQCIQFFSIVSFILHKIWYFLYNFQRVKILTENKKYLSVNFDSEHQFAIQCYSNDKWMYICMQKWYVSLNKYSSMTSCTWISFWRIYKCFFLLKSIHVAKKHYYPPLYSGINFEDMYCKLFSKKQHLKNRY